MGWVIENNRAVLTLDGYQCVFNQAEPYLGLELRDTDGSLAIDQLFAIGVAENCESYVRGNDLVSKHEARSSDLVSYHTYYRQLPDKLGIDFILSAQTSLLDSNPLAQVTTSIANAELVVGRGGQYTPVSHDSDFSREDADFFLLRPVESDAVSFLLSVHHSDFYRATVSVSAKLSVALWVFPASLEKGVIRRASFQFRVIPRQNDETRAGDVWSELVRAAPLLAT